MCYTLKTISQSRSGVCFGTFCAVNKMKTGRESMSFWELLLLAVALSMDAFAVSVCKGLAMDKVTLRRAGVVGLWFGGFQALMPLIGWLLGSQFERYITSIDHWVAFVLLALIGGNMIRESFSKEEEKADASLGFVTMLLLAIATSIDALAVGVTFAFLSINIWRSIALIGCTTFLLSAIGVKVGNLFGTRYKAKAEFVGGVVLVLLGVKILLEGLGVIG